MNHNKTYDQASEVTAEEGEVMIDGPDGVAVTVTPEAALETSERLLEGGLSAKGQQAEAKDRSRPK